MAPCNSPFAGRGGPGGAAQALSPKGGSSLGKCGQPQRRARASAGCGPWGPPTAKAASWFCGPDVGQASAGHAWPWAAWAPLRIQPWAVDFPRPSEPQPQALGPAESAHPWDPRPTRLPGGLHWGSFGCVPRPAMGGASLPVPGRGGVLPSGAAFGRCYTGRVGAPPRAPRSVSLSPCRGLLGCLGGSEPSGNLGSPAGSAWRGPPSGATAPWFSVSFPWVLGPEAGRPGRPGGTGVQHDDVAGEARPRGSMPGARRVFREGVHLPPRQGHSSQGIRYGLGGSLVCRGRRAPLRSQVAEPDVVEAASHTKPPAIVLRGIVPDDLVAALPLPLPPGLDCLIPFESRAAGLEGPSQASPSRTWEGLEGVPGLPVVGHLSTSHTLQALRAVRGNEVGPPSPQLSAL